MGIELVKAVAGNPATSRLSGNAEEHALYRFFNSEDALLYIGISIHPFARMGQHQGDKSWWGEVATVTIERHPNRADVLTAERAAIKAERPRYNVVHAARAKKRRPPRTHILYTYFEPAIQQVVTIPNVIPIDLIGLLIECRTCHGRTFASEVTDSGGSNDLHLSGTCPTCKSIISGHSPKQGREHQPYPMFRERGAR